MKLSLLAAAFAILCSSALIGAAAPKGKLVALTPDKAGPDFKVQGEYVGKAGDKKYGAQVIALGGGRFEAVLYRGGLPGAGWDGSKKIKLYTPPNGGTEFTDLRNPAEMRAPVFRGTILKGTFSVTGGALGSASLKKTERKSPTLGDKPPSGCIVLFDNPSDVKNWDGGKLNGIYLGVGVRTKRKFKDFKLHLEFQLPFMPEARGQGRANSGMYLLDQYECQILDSFGLQGKDNECGGIYKISSPKVNMCLPPLAWQTYDVDFTAAKFDEAGKKIAPAIVTIKQNGVTIHDKLKLKHATPGGRQSDEKPGALFLQNHGNPVRFRNIWLIEK